MDEPEEISEEISALDAIGAYSTLNSVDPIEASNSLAEVQDKPAANNDTKPAEKTAEPPLAISEQDEEDYVAESLSLEDFNDVDVPGIADDTTSELSPSDEADFNQARFIDMSDGSEFAESAISAHEIQSTPEPELVEAVSVEETSIVSSVSAVEDGHAPADLASVLVEVVPAMPVIPSTPPKPSQPMNAMSTRKRVRDHDGEFHVRPFRTPGLIYSNRLIVDSTPFKRLRGLSSDNDDEAIDAPLSLNLAAVLVNASQSASQAAHPPSTPPGVPGSSRLTPPESPTSPTPPHKSLRSVSGPPRSHFEIELPTMKEVMARRTASASQPLPSAVQPTPRRPLKRTRSVSKLVPQEDPSEFPRLPLILFTIGLIE